jgi:phosphatidylglycerol:prolipoprotein diacylglycerol transferase
MLHFPSINPVALQLGPLAIHWYGLMYLIGLGLAWGLGRYRAKHSKGVWTTQEVGDLIFYAAIGLIIGGRLGYVIFYAWPDFIAHPSIVFKIWQGGMSFHGGLLGGLLACWIFARHKSKSFFQVIDFGAPLIPLGLAAGRLGNFINGELWGRTTTAPWGMVFPHVDSFPRHPSQLYEFLLEGILLFFILWFFSRQNKPKMAVSGLFLMAYGSLRFFVEFFRQPDVQLGFVAFGWMSQGQLLCIPMILLGAVLFALAYSKKK